jgi:hypothetical protein
LVLGPVPREQLLAEYLHARLAEGSVFDASNRVSHGLGDMLDGREASQ